MPAPPPDGELQTRLLLPTSRRALPRWEISLGGQVVGFIEERHYRSIVFFEAVGLHNQTGEQVSLQLSTDFENRVEVVRRFWLEPLSCMQHLPWHLRRLHGLSS